MFRPLCTKKWETERLNMLMWCDRLIGFHVIHKYEVYSYWKSNEPLPQACSFIIMYCRRVKHSFIIMYCRRVKRSFIIMYCRRVKRSFIIMYCRRVKCSFIIIYCRKVKCSFIIMYCMRVKCSFIIMYCMRVKRSFIIMYCKSIPCQFTSIFLVWRASNLKNMFLKVKVSIILRSLDIKIPSDFGDFLQNGENTCILLDLIK